MIESISLDYINLLEIVIISIFIYIIGIVIFKWVWLNNVNFDLNEKSFYNFSQDYNYFRKIIILVRDLENTHNYWIQNVGFDGYGYILFMLEVSYSLILYLIFLCIFKLIIFLVNSILNIGVIDNPVWTSNSAEFQQIFQITVLTMLFIISFNGIRKKLQVIYYYYYIDPNKERGFNYLKLRTILVEGVDKFDINGDDLRDVFADKFYENGVRGSVYGIVMIPLCEKLLKIEMEKSLIEVYNNLIKNSDGKSPLSFFVSPYEEENAKKSIKELNLKIEKEIDKNIYKNSSNFSFVCFNSFNTVSNTVKLYK